jgi:hypothetical protein
MTYFSNYLENALINATVRNTTFTSPATVYLGLFTSDPTDAGTGTEVSGGSYARQSITFSSPSNGVTSNSAQITFPTATADWGTIGWIGIYDSLTSGNLLYHSPLTTSKIINNGDIFLVGSGNLTLTLS